MWFLQFWWRHWEFCLHMPGFRNYKNAAKKTLDLSEDSHYLRKRHHSPSPWPLGRPLADFGPLPAGAYFWLFDYILLIEILHRSTNPKSTLKTILELWVGSIQAQLDHGKTGDGDEMCHKKVQKMMKIMKHFIFTESSQNEARSISKLSERHKMMI